MGGVGPTGLNTAVVSEKVGKKDSAAADESGLLDKRRNTVKRESRVAALLEGTSDHTKVYVDEAEVATYTGVTLVIMEMDVDPTTWMNPMSSRYPREPRLSHGKWPTHVLLVVMHGDGLTGPDDDVLSEYANVSCFSNVHGRSKVSPDCKAVWEAKEGCLAFF